MDSKRHDDLEDELDLQALLDKYLPDEQNASDVKEANEVSEVNEVKEEVSEDAGELSIGDLADIDASEEENKVEDLRDFNTQEMFLGTNTSDDEANDDLSFFDDFVISDADEDANSTESPAPEIISDDADEFFESAMITEDDAAENAAAEESGDAGYDAYSEFSGEVDADGNGIPDSLETAEKAAVEEPVEEASAVSPDVAIKSAADAVLSLGDDELVIDEDIIAELMASNEAQFGGIEGFEDIETLSGFDATSSNEKVEETPKEEKKSASVDYSRDFTEEKVDDEDIDEYESDFVGATINELDSENHGETDMDFIVAFGLEDELGRHVGDKKASRLKKNYEKVVEQREELDRKSVHNEYRDESQNAEIISLYKKAYKSAKIKVIMTAIFSLILLIYENLPLIGYQLASFLDPAVYPVVYVMIDLQIALFAIAAVYDRVFYGFGKLFKGKPSPESIMSLTALIAIVYSIIAAASANPPTEPTLFNFPVAFCALMTAIHYYLTIKREIFSFNVISSKKQKYALRRLSPADAVMESAAFSDSGEDIGDVLKIEKVSFVDGYFYRTESANRTNSSVVVMCFGLSVILAVLFGIYSALVKNSVSASILMGYAAFVTSLPMTLLFSHSYPFYKANSNSYDVNSTIVGENTLEEYSGASVMTFDDKLVFPSVGVKVQNIKVYNNYRFDRVLYYAASVFTKTGGPLSDVFEIATVETGYSDDVLLTGIGEGFIQSDVDGKSIMFGRAEALIEQGVELPEDIVSEDEDEDENISVMYMIFKGKLVAKMNIYYSLDSDFEYTVKQLAGSGMSVCVKTLDPNIDEDMIRARVKLDKYPMRVIRYSSLEEVASVAEHTDSGIVSRGSAKGLLETVTYCDRVLESKRTSSFVCLIQAIVSVVILAVLLLSGRFSSFRSLFSVLLQAFWLIPMGIMTKTLLK